VESRSLSNFTPPITADPPTAPETIQPDRAIAALWRRVVAFFVDGVVLFVAATLIALPFFDTFSRLGSWGPLAGFCLAFPYFVILNSRIGNGQTLGKRLMHVQVVGRDGAAISFEKSVVRYTVFAVPYFLNELVLPLTRTPWAVSVLISIVIFGVGGATLYLVLFNRHTRQGIHDLSVGSYVAVADRHGPPSVEPIWGTHWMILGLTLAVLFLGTGILGNRIARWGPFPQMLEDVRLVEGIEGVQAAGAQDVNQSNSGSGEKKKILVINVYWAGESADTHAFSGTFTGPFREGWASKQAFADQVAKLIIGHDSTVNDHDSLKVVIIRGYNLGICRAQISYFYQHTPAEWSARLRGTSSAAEPLPGKL
jgi:uncharacterized RDD family membrane protein YckC